MLPKPQIHPSIQQRFTEKLTMSFLKRLFLRRKRRSLRRLLRVTTVMTMKKNTMRTRMVTKRRKAMMMRKNMVTTMEMTSLTQTRRIVISLILMLTDMFSWSMRLVLAMMQTGETPMND